MRTNGFNLDSLPPRCNSRCWKKIFENRFGWFFPPWFQGVLQNVRFVFGTTLDAILRNKGCESCEYSCFFASWEFNIWHQQHYTLAVKCWTTSSFFYCLLQLPKFYNRNCVTIEMDLELVYYSFSQSNSCSVGWLKQCCCFNPRVGKI